MTTVRLTMAQALVKYLSKQVVDIDSQLLPYFAGMWAIFGHGNVAGLGEALYSERLNLPTYRAHNEQGMAHSAIAFAKTMQRQRAMACTTSIGPGATNMVTAAALAHVNRLPLLLLPGDVFANRRPDPVLQQVEDFTDGTVSANDCFRPVSRYFDRITRPEQILSALPRAMGIFMDPANCGPVTLALCQDVQAEAFDYPESFFSETHWQVMRHTPDDSQITLLVEKLRNAKAPLIIAGGGVHYSKACQALSTLCEKSGIPVAETQAGKSALPWNHPQCLGGIGVTGTEAANAAAKRADLVVGLGTRLQDFTTGSRALFGNPECELIQVNVAVFDAFKHGATPIVGDCLKVLAALNQQFESEPLTIREEQQWPRFYQQAKEAWQAAADQALQDESTELPSDAQVIGAVERAALEESIIVCAAGGLPGELHKLWRSKQVGTYHAEYGYSCMGYEIAGGLGVKMAAPDRPVLVMVGDGSYLMMNSEIATAVSLGIQMTLVVPDNRGFGCINRLQQATGSSGFKNLLKDAEFKQMPNVDFVAHATSLGATASKAKTIEELETAIKAAQWREGVSVVVIETDPLASTEAGGHWWDVAVPEVSERYSVNTAHKQYKKGQKKQRLHR